MTKSESQVRPDQPAHATGMRIRLATEADLAAINDIYNHYVLHSTCTYQTDIETPAGRANWFLARGPAHPVTVAEQAGQVIGWAALSPFRRPDAYRHTVENSVYVRPNLHRRGIGQALLADSIERARALGHRNILAVISADQSASIALHAKMGFTEVAHLRQVGYKFNRWLDVIIMQYVVKPETRNQNDERP